MLKVMFGKLSPAAAIVAGCAALTGCSGTQGDLGGEDVPNDESVHQPSNPAIVRGALLPRGEKGVSYADENTEELRAWGPSALRADRDGTFWIADVAADRLVHVKEDGTYLGATALPHEVQAATDFEIATDGFVVLDLAGDGSKVVRFSRDGGLLDIERLSEELSVEATGLLRTGQDVQLHLGDAHVAALGQVLIQKDAGKVKAQDLRLGDRSVQIVAERAIEGHDSALRSAVAKLGDDTVRIAAKGWLGAVRVAHVFDNGGLLLSVEDMNMGPELQVDLSLWHIDGNGQVLGKANVPTDEQYTYVEHAIAVQPDGDVFALVTRPDGAELRQLAFVTDYEPAVDAVDPAKLTGQVAVAKAGCTITQTAARQIASDYVNNRTYLTTTNLSGACTGRTRPRYLGTAAGYYNSVPYDWGGFDSVANYNSHMTGGKQAGDVETSTIEACSKGVDCSGFVARAWGRTTRLTTSTIPKHTCQLSSTAALKLGDVMNLAGNHVAMFSSQINSTEAYWYEATKTDKVDRVVYWKKPYSRFAKYQPRRYLEMCGAVCE